MFHLNDKGCHHNMKRRSKWGEASFEDRVQAEFRAELHDIYHQVNDSNNEVLQEDFERLCKVKSKGGNVPLEVLTAMAETIAAESSNNLEPIFIKSLDEQVQRLCGALGSCERIVKTPLPTGFTRHSSRLLFIWSNSLPFALYPVLGPFGTLPTALLTVYAVLGIEDLSVQLEEPFDILPLRQYSDSMFDGIKAMEQSYTPSFPSSAGGEHANKE
jgi:predicted membrane chloride channel (bestrophin family)